MTDIETEPRMADAFGVPEFFVTDVGLIESACGGNIRVIHCIKRGGMLLPVFSLVKPMLNIIMSAQAVRDAAQELFKLELGGGVSRHH